MDLKPVGPPPSPSLLLGAASAERYLELIDLGAERVAAKLRGVDRPFSGVRPRELAGPVARVDLGTPLRSAEEALDELEQLYLHDAVYFHHPRYLAHLNCPVLLPAVLAETLIASINSSMDTWDQSAGATLIERRLVAWSCRQAGLGPEADGVFTSGGTQSNLEALALARDEALAQGARFGDLRVFASEVSHFSLQTACRLLGLGEDAVVTVEADEHLRLRPDRLREALADAPANEQVPMAVVATAGTTDFGTIDPIDAMADATEPCGSWLHVDAAYGCGLLVSPTRRDLLHGIERATSVTADFHKAFFQPIASSVLLVRSRRLLRHVAHHAEYLNPSSATTPDQVEKSLQTTRRFDALKLWLTLRMLGADQVGELFEACCTTARAGYDVLAADDRFEVVVEPTLSTLVFRYVGDGSHAEEELAEANRRARADLMRSGDAVVAATRVRGVQHLKFTLLNPSTTLEDITTVLDLLAERAEADLVVAEAAA